MAVFHDHHYFDKLFFHCIRGSGSGAAISASEEVDLHGAKDPKPLIFTIMAHRIKLCLSGRFCATITIVHFASRSLRKGTSRKGHPERISNNKLMTPLDERHSSQLRGPPAVDSLLVVSTQDRNDRK